MEKVNQVQTRYFIIFSFLQLSLAQIIMQFMKSLAVGTEKDFISFLISTSFYLFIFIIPVILYLKTIDKVNLLNYLKMDSNLLRSVLTGLLIGVGIFIFLLIKNQLKIVVPVNYREEIFILLGKILVGLFEEIPFRGFYLQKFNHYMGFWQANLFSSILFASMHIPLLINAGTHVINSIIFMIIIGLWMGYIFKVTKSLWCVVIIHSIYDLSIWIIY